MVLQLPITYLGHSVDKNWNTVVNLLHPNDELPLPSSLTNFYLDFETTSGEEDVASIHPHKKCKILGAAVLFDNESIPYYAPVRHAYIDDKGEYCYNRNDCPNISVERVIEWIIELLRRTKFWINHNIKYDCHVLINETGHIPQCAMLDTLNLSKLAPIQERFSYGLTEMLKELGIDISPYEAGIKQFLGRKVKDYGLIPPDHMGVYAGVDVLATRHLFRWCNANIHKGCKRIVSTEHQLLPMLLQMEQIGLKTDRNKLLKDLHGIHGRQHRRITKIKSLTGMKHFDPGKKEYLEKLFCDVLGWKMDFSDATLKKLAECELPEDEIEYSFDKASVSKHYDENPHLVKTYLEYQKEQKLLTSFTTPYYTQHVLGWDLIHPNNNQIVRTGRLSCTFPNMMQLSEPAKEYIIPWDEDYALVNFDLSQIEFRVIVHYIDNKKAIKAFNDDPTTDFHVWVADMCGIPRKPAKNVNFALGYGAGKGKCLTMLSTLKEISGNLKTEELRVQRALQVYNKYHEVLPELKPTQYRAGDVIKSRGFVRTLLGRERHLPYEFHYKAFNSVCQGSAADLFKDICLRLQKFISMDCLLHALIHDAFLFSIKKNRVNELVPLIKEEIERPIADVNFSVPLRVDYGISAENWRFTDKKEIFKSKIENANNDLFLRGIVA